MKRILVIEDEKNIRETLCDLLELHGYETSEAADGETGLKKAMTTDHHMIICDINMPKKDGYEVLVALKKKHKLTSTSFIFLTADASMDQLRKGMESGADDYLVKPFTSDSLIRTIKSIEDKRAMQVKKLHALQVELQTEKTRIKDIDQLNSHEIRRKMSLLQSLFPMIRNGDIPFPDGMKLLESCGEEIDRAIHLLSSLIDERNGAVNTKMLDITNITSIWLIDDDSIQNLINRMILKKMNRNWEIKEFTDAQKALSQLDKETPDLIFLDISMPEMGGFEFLCQIQQKKNNQIKIAMLSSSISYKEINKAISFSQVIHYISKPLKEEKLQHVLR